jgi:Dyp-type peroxidase family
MSRLDLPDIQGNINRPYGRFGFPYSRHLFFAVHDPVAGRRFVQAIRPRVTTAEPWDQTETADGHTLVSKPPITLNIGFTYAGLQALDLPTPTLRMLPDEFIDGMSRRAEILGDVGPSGPQSWEAVWAGAEQTAHVWVSLNVGALPGGEPLPVLQEWTDWLIGLTTADPGVGLLRGHTADGAQAWQDSAALMMDLPDGGKTPCAKEHFGFTDGISDPVFQGQFGPEAEALAAIGGGKIAEGAYDQATSWSALETGEFLLGHPDEGQQLPVAAEPQSFSRNGAFVAWRKLREEVDEMDAYVAQQAQLWMRAMGETDAVAADETIRAKIVGRWRSGIPLIAAPTWADHQTLMAEYADCIAIALRKPRDDKERQRLAQYDKLLTGFRYGDDLDGSKCPFGAHIRRANPRDMLDPLLSATEGSSTLTNRRRILRRGLPYVDPSGEKGVIFMAVCASLFRQFEFIQQQWMSYGLDFDAGNDTCPLVGNRAQSDKHVMPAGAANPTPFIAAAMPQFVTTRGGDYFFLPSMTAIRMIAMGTIDPT